MHIASTAFQDNESIPAEHSRNGGNISPPLTFSEVPVTAKSLVLVLDDPDVPGGLFTHWILYDMSPATLQIMPGELPLEGKQATNDFGQAAYGGPQPPSGTHRYVFRLFALDSALDGLRPTDKRPTLDAAIKGHIIGQAELTGVYAAEQA